MFRIFSYLQVRFSGAGERSFLKKKNSNYSEDNCEGTGQLRKINKKTEVPVLGASVFLILDKIKKNAGNGT